MLKNHATHPTATTQNIFDQNQKESTTTTSAAYLDVKGEKNTTTAIALTQDEQEIISAYVSEMILTGWNQHNSVAEEPKAHYANAYVYVSHSLCNDVSFQVR